MNHELNTTNTFTANDRELHGRVLRYGFVDPKSQKRETKSQHIQPSSLPWCGYSEADFHEPHPQSIPDSTDKVSQQYELHSTTKFHQLDGLYESYSSHRKGNIQTSGK